ncbi:hypothetical protein D3C77_184530 [compost metagenome]
MTALRRKTVIRGCPMRPLDLKAICDVCEKPRNRGNHEQCSKKRQSITAERRAREQQP